jgi:hypothetical protein
MRTYLVYLTLNIIFSVVYPLFNQWLWWDNGIQLHHLWYAVSLSLVWGMGRSQALRALHTMAEGWQAVDFHQSHCKKSRVRPLDPSHYGQSPRYNLKWLLFEEGDGLLKEVWVGWEWGPVHTMAVQVERPCDWEAKLCWESKEMSWK